MSRLIKKENFSIKLAEPAKKQMLFRYFYFMTGSCPIRS